MPMIFVLTNVIYIVYDRKNENHWSLLITRYSLLGIQTPSNRNTQCVLTDRLLCSSGNFCINYTICMRFKDIANINRYPYERFIKESQSKTKAEVNNV